MTLSNCFRTLRMDYKFMLVTLFFMRVGQFMLLPFIAIYLAKFFQISPTTNGLIVGSGLLAYGIISYFSGHIVDKFGAKPVFIWSLFCSAIITFFFFQVKSIYWLLFMNILTGLTRSSFDVSSKSYGIHLLSSEQRKFCFGLRFMVVNSAASLGPVLGAYFAINNSLSAFETVGVLYFVLGVSSLFTLKNIDKSPDSIVSKRLGLLDSFSLIKRDKTLKLLVVISIIIWVIYSQLDSTLPQYLYATLKDGVHVYSLLLIINAVGCAALQMMIYRLTRNCNELFLSYVSLLLFAIGYAFLAFFLNLPLMIISMLIIVVAECILIPLNDMLLSKISSPELMGTYYGAISTAMLGLGIGPIIGGIIYENFNARFLFLFCSFLCLLLMVFYKFFIESIPGTESISGIESITGFVE